MWRDRSPCAVFRQSFSACVSLLIHTSRDADKKRQAERREYFRPFDYLFSEYCRGVLSILVMPAVALLPAISLKGSELMSFGSMSSGLGFGAVAAAVLMQRNRRIIHHVTTVWTGGWVTCIAFAVLPALETVTSQWLCALVAGGSLTFALAAANNLVQCKAPDIYRGRFSAMYLAVMLGLVPVGQLILGFASEQFTAVVAVRACAVIAMVLMVLFAFLFSISKAEETVGPD
ncbi:MFS transporter [Parasutterella sp.]|uniref:MFS transporter n=1 Tax=Parasutterella sp. TaxID=2049037 RepID=UPI0039933906